MTLLGRTLIALALTAAVAAVWLTAHWFQFLITAVLLMAAGAGILGNAKDKP